MNKIKSGLTPQEEKVMDMLVNAWNEFSKIEATHPTEKQEFCDSLHRLQDLLAARIVRRDYPGYWRGNV
jgi:hypothetical protein